MEDKIKILIDQEIDKFLKDKDNFTNQCNNVIDMMKSDSELIDALSFYESVFNKIINKDEKLSYKKKLHFLSLHKTSIKIVNQFFNQ